MSPPPKTSTFRLIVEGDDDLHTVIHLLARHGYDWDDATATRPYVHPAGSIDKVLDSIAVAAKTYERLGVVVDADLDSSARWAAIAERLRRAGYDVPKALPSAGAVLSHDSLARVGVWLMPDNQTAGRLEELLHTLVPANDPVCSVAERATDDAMAAGAPLRPVDRLKGILHAWLAWQEPPGMAYGTAVKARVFDHDSAQALGFVAWFHELFGTSAP